MTRYTLDADDVFINATINSTTTFPTDDESFSRISRTFQDEFPILRDRSVGTSTELALEGETGTGGSVWSSLESRRFSLGVVNPPSLDEAFAIHRAILQAAVRILPIKEEECEVIDLLFGFDLNYLGNHDQAIARGLGLGPSLHSLLELPGMQVIDFQPSVSLGMDAECLVQCRLSVESRTAVSQVVSGEFPGEPLSVYFAVRRHRGSEGPLQLTQSLQELQTLGASLIQEKVIPRIVRPLRQAIASS